MKIKAEQKLIRISPQKMRRIVNSIKHLPPHQALVQLEFISNRSASSIAKVIKQALANASHNFNLTTTTMIFDSIQVNEGPTFKRWRAVSRGRAHSIAKRTSHLIVTLNSPSVSTKPLKQSTPTLSKSTPPPVSTSKPLQPTSTTTTQPSKPFTSVPQSVIKSPKKPQATKSK